MRFGCIADDFTGATDLTRSLVRDGMRLVQIFGAPWPRWRKHEETARLWLMSHTKPEPLGAAPIDELREIFGPHR